MKKLEDIILQQKDFIDELTAKTADFVRSLDKTHIQTVLLSGSVSRKDYFPGEMGGMVDLTVIRKTGSTASAEQIFGKDEEPEIPYHCVTVDGIGYQIKFMEHFTEKDFAAMEMDEAQKFALFESVILYDTDRAYEAEFAGIKKMAQEEIKNKLGWDFGYVDYLISDYKKDRWYRRDAYIQLHENLNNAIKVAVRCLYYINNSYAPAEDRSLYYSLSLPNLPQNYENVITRVCNQTTDSIKDYEERERLFRAHIVSFIEKYV